jgi:hypothetical protein
MLRLLLLLLLPLSLASPARADPVFFGEDLGVCPGPFPCALAIPNASAAESAFLAALLDPGTEDLSAFESGDGGTLPLSFVGAGMHGGTLVDPTTDQDGYVGTSQHQDRGFPITGIPFWKNRSEEGEGLFRVDFDEPVRAFGFYATAYSTLSEPGSTQLVLELEPAGGGPPLAFGIAHATTETPGSVFYFGVISDPFLRATLRNASDEDGDVIGFDDFTAATAVVPEPSTGLLLATGLLGLAASARRGPRRRDSGRA